jgi:hypothetical protein
VSHRCRAHVRCAQRSGRRVRSRRRPEGAAMHRSASLPCSSSLRSVTRPHVHSESPLCKLPVRQSTGRISPRDMLPPLQPICAICASAMVLTGKPACRNGATCNQVALSSRPRRCTRTSCEDTRLTLLLAASRHILVKGCCRRKGWHTKVRSAGLIAVRTYEALLCVVA